MACGVTEDDRTRLIHLALGFRAFASDVLRPEINPSLYYNFTSHLVYTAIALSRNERTGYDFVSLVDWLKMFLPPVRRTCYTYWNLCSFRFIYRRHGFYLILPVIRMLPGRPLRSFC